MFTYNQQPTDPIFRDAYSIADAVVRQHDQEKRMNKALEQQGAMGSTVHKLSADIVRLQNLINERVAVWVGNYGTAMVWSQYLDGHPHADKVRG